LAAAGGFAGAVASTAISGDWDNIGNNILIGTISGAATGAIGGTGLGIGLQIGINVAIGMGSYAANTAMNGGKITLGGLISSGIFGAVAGAIGGNGTLNDTDKIAESFISSGVKNFFGAMLRSGIKELSMDLIKEVFSSIIIGGIFDGLYSRFFGKKLNPNNNFIGW